MSFMSYAQRAEDQMERAMTLHDAFPDTPEERERLACLQAADVYSRLALGSSQMELAEAQKTLASTQKRSAR